MRALLLWVLRRPPRAARGCLRFCCCLPGGCCVVVMGSLALLGLVLALEVLRHLS
ncbi:MAG: hypothetical protein ACREN7_10415 [Candidatus Dormibacteria bacterium]